MHLPRLPVYYRSTTDHLLPIINDGGMAESDSEGPKIMLQLISTYDLICDFLRFGGGHEEWGSYTPSSRISGSLDLVNFELKLLDCSPGWLLPHELASAEHEGSDILISAVMGASNLLILQALCW